MSAPMPWIKLHTSLLNDERILELTDSARARYYELLMLAGIKDAGGELIRNDGKPMTVANLAVQLRISTDRVEADLKELIGNGLVTSDNGLFALTGFAETQGPTQAEKRIEWAERQQRNRRVKKEDDVTRDTDVTHSDVTRLDKDIDIDKEEDKDKEKEIPASADRPRDIFFDKLAEISCADPKLNGPVLGKMKSRLMKVNATLEQLVHFEKYWYDADWRGKQGQSPTPQQVVAEWERARKWIPGATVRRGNLQQAEPPSRIGKGMDF